MYLYVFVFIALIPISFASDKKIEIREDISESYYKATEDYSRLMGRVTDRDDAHSMIKITSENKNIKFLRSGDLVEFRVAAQDTKYCRGFIRGVEKSYIILYYVSLKNCWKYRKFLRRGTLLVMKSSTLASRVRDAHYYRKILVKRRKDFFKQLNQINHFLWSFDQQKIKVAAKYDKKLNELKIARRKALEHLSDKRRNSIVLRGELHKRLNKLDNDLLYHRIENNNEQLVDKWVLDRPLALPIIKK